MDHKLVSILVVNPIKVEIWWDKIHEGLQRPIIYYQYSSIIIYVIYILFGIFSKNVWKLRIVLDYGHKHF